jgi:dihydroxyacetone kinase
LFEVPAGKVAVGLGIHGEPGVGQTQLVDASGAADVLVEGLFAERRSVAGQRVAVLVNGLGTTIADELYLVFRRVRERFEDAGLVMVRPVVGDLVTSLDMAGVSLSVMYLTDELERLWLAPADSACFSRGRIGVRGPRKTRTSVAERQSGGLVIPDASAVSREFAGGVAAWFESVAGLLADREESLGDIDRVAGDGDHGAGMRRGSAGAARAAQDAAGLGAGVGTVLGLAARAWADAAGGASGALWGAGLTAAGRLVGDRDAPDAGVVVLAARAFADEIMTRGGARVGDKTMVDAVVPFVDALERHVAAGFGLGRAWQAAAVEAAGAAAGTADFAAKVGRARTHGEGSLGTPDAGATSFALVVARLGEPAWPTDGVS